MSDVLWFAGRFTTTDEPVLTVADRGLLFGDAVYEVLKFVDGAPVLFGDHWNRLERSLGLLEIENPWTVEELASIVDELLERTGFDAGIIYVQVSRGAGRRSHAWSDDFAPVGFVYSSRGPFPDEAMQKDGVSVITFEDERWAGCEIKSVNLLPNVIAKTRARRSGAYELIFVNGGRIIEGSSSNVFAVLDGVVVTPAEGRELLSGTVRAAIISLAGEAGLEVREGVLRLSDLEEASEVLITSTTTMVLPVTEVDGQQIGNGARGPVTARLQKAFVNLEREEAARWNRGERPWSR